MTQTLNQNNIEFQQKQFIMMGGTIKINQKKLSQATKEKMIKDYRNMYYAFTSINWGNGMNLGMAWQKALEQMDAFVATKAKIPNHPANQDLVKYHSEFRRNMAREIMTNENSNIKLEERLKKLFLTNGNTELKKAKSSLDEIYKQYMPTKQITKQPKTVILNLAKKRTEQFMQMILMQQQRQKSA